VTRGPRRPAVFFDRDGTLIQDRDYLSDPKGVRLLPGAVQAVRLLKAAGYRVYLVSNQSGVARGYFGAAAVHRVNRRFRDLLGVRLDGVFFCPHHPKGEVARYRKACACRKPAPGMVRQAAKRHPLDLPNSYIVGDKPDDVLLAPRAGLRGGLLVLTGYGRKSRGSLKSRDRLAVVKDALAAARWILKQQRMAVGGQRMAFSSQS